MFNPSLRLCPDNIFTRLRRLENRKDQFKMASSVITAITSSVKAK
jgi:hypothetical protein